MIKRAALWVCCLFFSSALIANSPLVNYKAETQLSITNSKNPLLKITQTIDFQCRFHFKEERLESITLTFKRIQGELDDSQNHFVVDTEANTSSYEENSLTHLIHQPIEVYLNRDFTLKKPIEQFEALLKLFSLQDRYINEDLIDQLFSAILAPVLYDKQYNLLSQKLYFPLKSTITLTPNFSVHKKGSELFIDQNLDLQGDILLDSNSSSLQLTGDLSGEIQWKKEISYVKSYSLSHRLKEKAIEPLFSSPLQFDYSFNLQQLNRG